MFMDNNLISIRNHNDINFVRDRFSHVFKSAVRLLSQRRTTRVSELCYQLQH